MDKIQIFNIKMLNFSLPVFWRQLRWNLIFYFVALAVLPVIVVMFIIINQTRDQVRSQVENQMEAVAELKREQIIRWLEDSQAGLKLFLTDPRGRATLVALATTRGADILTVDYLNNLLSKAVEAQPLIEGFFYYDTQGRILAASDPASVGKVVTRQPYFKPSLEADYIQPPYYAVGSARLVAFITQPVADQNGRIVGVMAGQLNLDTLGQIMTTQIGLGKSSVTYLVSRESNYFVTPSRGYNLTHKYHSLGIDNVLQGKQGKDSYDDFRTPSVRVIGAYHWIEEMQVGLLAEVDEAEALSSFTNAVNISLLSTLIVALIAAGFGFYNATRLSKPITTLTQVATAIAAGDLSQRVEIKERNELGLLASAFNSMTAQLREFISNLEERIQERTKALEAGASISRQITTILDTDELLQEVVNNIQIAFNYYHVHIYLIDEKTNELVMREGSGPVGRQLKSQGHKLQWGQGIVGRVAERGEPFLANNVNEIPHFIRNPHLSKTQAELAVPLRKGNVVLGVLDIQSEEVDGFSDQELTLMQSIADQVAVALDNARLFRRLQTAAAEAEELTRRLTRDAWQDIGNRAKTTGYTFTKKGVIPEPMAWLSAMERAVSQRSMIHDTGDNNGNEADKAAANVAVPLILRGEVIGVIGIERPAEQQWSEDEMTTIETITEQVALALDAARLARETERSAWRDQIVSEATARVWSSDEIEEVMRQAVTQLGDKLHASEVVIRLGTGVELAHE